MNHSIIREQEQIFARADNLYHNTLNDTIRILAFTVLTGIIEAKTESDISDCTRAVEGLEAEEAAHLQRLAETEEFSDA